MSHQWIRPSILVLTATLCAGTASRAGQDTAIDDGHTSYRSTAAYWADAFERLIGATAAGYAYAVYHDGAPVAVGAGGYAQLPSAENPDGLRMTAQTPMQIASVSKSITAVALLHALASTDIDIDAPIRPLLEPMFPGIDPAFDEITARLLLTHRTGFEFGYVETPRLENTQRVLEKGPSGEPGGDYEYSNINTSLARTLLEVTTGREYEDYVREELFLPVGATTMATRADPAITSHAHRFTTPISGAPLTIDFTDEAGPYGWYGSVEDVLLFALNVRNYRYLGEDDTDRMFADGLGWSSRSTHAGPVYGHDGQWIIDEEGTGVRAGFAIFPQGVTAALFINTNGPYFPRLLLQRVFDESLPRIAYQIDEDGGTVAARAETPPMASCVRCTVDGTPPEASTPITSGPITAPLPAVIRCRGFADGAPVGFENRLDVDENSDRFKTY